MSDTMSRVMLKFLMTARLFNPVSDLSHICDDSRQIIDLLLRDDSFSHQPLPLSTLRLSISMPAYHVFGRRRHNNAKNLYEQKRAKKKDLKQKQNLMSLMIY